MATILDELVAIIGIDVDKQKLQTANNSLKQISINFIGIKTAVLAASVVIYEFERRMVKSIATISQTSQNLHFNAQELQVLQYAAEKAGVSIGDVAQSISNVNNELSNAASGHPGQGFLEALGQLTTLSGQSQDFGDAATATGEEVYNRAIKALSKIQNSPQALNISKGIFSINIIPIIKKMDAARKEMIKDHTLQSDKQLKKSDDANQAFIRLSKNVQSAAQELAVDLSPAFERLAKVVIDVTTAFKSYHSFLESFGKGAGKTIDFVAEGTKGVFQLFTDPSTFLGQLDNSVRAYGEQLKSKQAKEKSDRFNYLLHPDISKYLLNKQNDPIRQSIENNNSRTNNTTINNTFMPSNMQSIYTIGGNI